MGKVYGRIYASSRAPALPQTAHLLPPVTASAYAPVVHASGLDAINSINGFIFVRDQFRHW